MLLTEEEAKKKWCPMARAVAYRGGDIGPANRVTASHGAADSEEISGASKCLASGCMMWLWNHWSSLESAQTKSELVVQDGGHSYWRSIPPPGDGWREVHEREQDKEGKWRLKEKELVGVTNWVRPNYGERAVTSSLPRGYCGLAGEPKDFR